MVCRRQNGTGQEWMAVEIKDYEMILDSMQTTGVYVVREDNHQILYFNRHMKELAPDIETGKVCHELWLGSCDNCPLLYIGDKRENRSISFRAPFGETVDLTAVRIQWEEHIPAFVIMIAPHVEALSYTYSWILKANLTKDSFDVIKSAPEADGISSCGKESLSQWLAQFMAKGYIHSSDIGRFQSFIQLEYLRNELKKGKKKLTCAYRYMLAQDYRWYTIEIIEDSDYSPDNQTVIIYVKDVNDVYREGLELEEINIRNREIIASLGQLSFDVYVVNLRTGVLNPIQVSEDIDIMVRQGILDWDTLLSRMVEAYFHPEYKERMLKTYSLEALRKFSEEGREKVEILCQRSFHGIYRYVSTVAYFDEKKAKNNYAILAMKDVDEQSRQEIKRSQDDLRMAAVIKSRYSVMNTVNLENGMCERVYLHEADEKTGVWLGNYDSFIQKTADEEVLEQDREEFLKILSLERLREHASGVEDFSELACRYRLKGPPVTWIKDHVFFVRYNDTIMVNILSRDITFEKVKELADTKSRNERASIINSLSRLFFATYYLDFERNTYRMVTQMDAVGEILGEILGAEANCREAFHIYAQRFVHPDDREDYLNVMDIDKLIQNLSDKHPIVSIEYHRIKTEPDGTILDDGWIRASAVLAESENGKPKKAVYVAQDITEARQKEKDSQRALMEAYDAAKQASVAKSDFLSKMSHDIRTPMNAIIGMTAIASSHLEDSERVADCLNKIMVSSNHLLSLINEVLDMSRIESGKLELAEENFNLSDLIQNVITMVRPSIQEKQHELALHTEKVEHENLSGDVVRLQQVFVNILSNAVKYTPPGGKLELRISEKPSKVFGYGCYEFIFRDNGIGMSEEFQKRIFEPFSRAEDSRVSKVEGTGLGMAITMNIIHMMNGDISVASRVGEGSKFTVTMYLKQQNIKALDTRQFEGLSVLVVDDDEYDCRSACEILDSIGIQSQWAVDGIEGIRQLKEAHQAGNDFFAVFLDLKMPNMDGIQTAREVRKELGTDVWIILLSAGDWSSVETEARQAGVDAFISKPLFKSRLIYLLKQFAGEEEEAEMTPTELLSKCNFCGKRILLAEDIDLNREIAEEFIKNTGAMVESVSNGQEALERFIEKGEGYYDLIFMDIQMPVMNGYKAAASIRAQNRTDAELIPIIAMTANAFTEDIVASRKAGMNEHITKPLSIMQLLDCMKRWIPVNDAEAEEDKKSPAQNAEL